MIMLPASVLIVGGPALFAGPPVTAAGPTPHRIVSLGPTITEKLYLLGVEDYLVGVTTYCVRPPEACAKEKIGNVTQVNIEKIVDLKPDLVLATSLTDHRAVESLKRLGIGVIVFDEPRSYAETNEQFLELGRIVGREREARRDRNGYGPAGRCHKEAHKRSPSADRFRPARHEAPLCSDKGFFRE